MIKISCIPFPPLASFCTPLILDMGENARKSMGMNTRKIKRGAFIQRPSCTYKNTLYYCATPGLSSSLNSFSNFSTLGSITKRQYIWPGFALK